MTAVDSTSPESLRTTAELADYLSSRREAAGLTVRQLAKASGVPLSTLGGYLTGRHLPPANRPEVLLGVLAALGVDTTPTESWRALLHRLARTRLPRGGDRVAPYPGLVPFDVDTADYFVGREDEVENLLGLVEQARRDVEGGARGVAPPVVLVVGPSGSGKSSLVRGGVVPVLQDTWQVVRARPGARAADAFAHARHVVDTESPSDPEYPSRDPDRPVLVVVDQLEEIWSAAGDDGGSDALEVLLAPTERQVVVVATMRADRYDSAARVPVLAQALRQRQLLVEPLGAPALARAVVEPAEAAGAAVAPGLVDRIVADAARHARDARLGVALPYVSYCLRQMWDGRERNLLSHELYESVGGIEGALRHTADSVLAGLDPLDHDVAHQLLVRLVRLEPDTAPMAVPVPVVDLATEAERRVVDQLAAARLVVVDDANVRLAHEALISAWPRLQGWLEDDRELLLAVSAIERSAREWRASGGDPDLLLRGARLESSSRPGAEALLGAAATELVAESRAAAAREREQRVRRDRRLRLLLVATSVVTVLALAAVVGLVVTSRTAAHERDLARSRQLAAQARDLADLDPAMSAQLALAAGSTADTLEGRSAVVDAAASPRTVNVNGPTGLRFVAASPAAGLLASAGESPELLLYDVSGVAPQRVATLPAPVDGSPGGAVFALAVSDDGRWLAAGGTAGILRVWDVADRARPQVVLDVPAVGGTVNDVAFTADSSTLLVGAAAGAEDAVLPVRRWRLAEVPAELEPLPSRARVSALAILSGGLVAIGDADGHVVVRDPAQPGTVLADRLVVERQVTGIAQQGEALAVSTRASKAFLLPWDAGRRSLGEPREVGSFANWVNDAAASPGADLVAFASSDKTVAVVDGTGTVRETVHVADNVTAVSFVGNRRLAVAVVNGQTLLRDLPPYPGNGGIGTVYSTGWARDRPLAVVNTVGAGEDKDVSIWDVRDPSRPREVGRIRSGPAPGRSVGGGDISPDGRLLVYVTDAGYLAGVDVTDPSHPVDRFSTRITTSTVEQLSFVADDVVAAASDDQHVRLLRVADGADPVTVADLTGPLAAGELLFSVSASADLSTVVSSSSAGAAYVWRPKEGPRPVARVSTPGYAYAAALSADGRTLAVSGTDRSIRVWDLTTPAHPRSVTTFGGATGTTFTLEFDATGQRLLAAVNDGSLVLWRRDGARYTRTLVLDRGTPLYFARFSPDGSHVLAGGLGGYTKLTPTTAATATRSLCGTVGDWIPPARWSASIAVPDLPDPCTDR